MTIPMTAKSVSERFDLDALLHPAGTFAHPLDVVHDPGLTLDEKRAILASWASDACAVEAAPELRQTPAGNTVRFDDIMDALRLIDQNAAMHGKYEARSRRAFANRFPGLFGHGRTRPRNAGQAPVES
ncbi:MAG TPA: hypothetical protein VNL39_13220 [Xanthobacteraceae bacterium]|nr:hypothetical protein [Xanthobacteraceae bacterium]